MKLNIHSIRDRTGTEQKNKDNSRTKHQQRPQTAKPKRKGEQEKTLDPF